MYEHVNQRQGRANIMFSNYYPRTYLVIGPFRSS